MQQYSRLRTLLILLGFAGAAFLFCSEILSPLERWGNYDWSLFFFHNLSVYRSIVEFREIPLWNPWYKGGMPLLANPQAPFVDPLFLFDLLCGPIVAIKIKIVISYFIGLVGTYWCGRSLGLSCLAAIYAACSFVFSTWLSLHLHAGHYWCLTSVYIPWVIGLVHRSLKGYMLTSVSLGGLLIGLMVLAGGGAHIVTMLSIALSVLSLGWSLQHRSIRPLLATGLIFCLGFGLAAVKLVPSIKLLREYPRYTVPGGGWLARPKLPPGSPGKPVEEAVTPPASGTSRPRDAMVLVGDESRPLDERIPKPSKWNLPPMIFKIFLGRDQQSDTNYFPNQGFGWHEYGSYVGPFLVLLLAGFPLALRCQWPWLATGMICFLTALGNFAHFAPWTLLHHFPILNNMRNPTRFLIPTCFFLCMFSAMVLDAIYCRLQIKRERDLRASASSTGWPSVLLVAVVLLALADVFLVGRASLNGTFPFPPPEIAPRSPTIISVKGDTTHSAVAMLSNYCFVEIAEFFEVIRVPARVSYVGRSDYRGELYFAPSDPATPSDNERVELVSWSPNSARVLLSTPRAGRLVLNRNWADGWEAQAPYEIAPFEGLISVQLEPGTHLVEFAYRPWVLKVGTIISVGTLALTGIVIWVGRRRRTSIDAKP